MVDPQRLLDKRFLWLVAAMLIVWWPALLGASVYDDVLNIDRNAALREFDVPRLVSEPFFREHLHYWRPLSQLLLGIASQLGMAAIHATALLLHAISAWIGVCLLRNRLQFRSSTALWGAVLFMVHPIHAECLAWASAFPEVLAGTLSVAALYAAMAGTRMGWVLSSALLLAALLAHEAAMAMVPVIVGWSWMAGQPRTVLARLGIPLHAAACGMWLVLRHLVLGHTLTVTDGGQTLLSYLGGGGEVFLRNASLVLVPWQLSPFRTGPSVFVDGVLVWADVVGIAIGGVALVVAFVLWRRCLRLRGMLLLMIGPALLSTVVWPSLGEFCIQDRYLYPATLGVAALIATAAARHRWLLASIACALAATAHTQTWIWHDQPALVAHALRVAPQLATTQIMAGDSRLEQAGQEGEEPLQLARNHYRAALQSVFPRDRALQSERRAAAYIGLGWCEFMWKNTSFPQDEERVAALFRKGLAESADSAAGWVGLGSTHALAKNYQLAEQAFRRAIAVDPARAEAWYNLGVLKVELGALAEARASFREALRHNPGLEGARQMLQELQEK